MIPVAIYRLALVGVVFVALKFLALREFFLLVLILETIVEAWMITGKGMRKEGDRTEGRD